MAPDQATANDPASRRATASTPSAALRVGLLGAECTGKSTLAKDLATALAPDCEVAVAAEALRDFVDQHGRTPARGEQAAVMAAQIANENAALARLRAGGSANLAAGAGFDGATAGGLAASPQAGASPHRCILICDPCALMTAIYSMAYFSDSGLLAAGLVHQRVYDVVLLCGPDIPWTADAGQRDGPDRRMQVADLLTQVVTQQRVPVISVGGDRAARVKRAMEEVDPRQRHGAGVPIRATTYSPD